MLSYLFGTILTVERGEVWVVVALGAVIVTAIAFAHRALFAMVVDEEWARVAGLPVEALNALLAVLTALTIVASMRIVGILLVAAMMVLPVASAQLLARSQWAVLVWASGLGVSSVVVGLAAARQWGLAPGGTIVLVAVATFLVLSVGLTLVGGRPGHGVRTVLPMADR